MDTTPLANLNFDDLNLWRRVALLELLATKPAQFDLEMASRVLKVKIDTVSKLFNTLPLLASQREQWVAEHPTLA